MVEWNGVLWRDKGEAKIILNERGRRVKEGMCEVQLILKALCKALRKPATVDNSHVILKDISIHKLIYYVPHWSLADEFTLDTFIQKDCLFIFKQGFACWKQTRTRAWTWGGGIINQVFECFSRVYQAVLCQRFLDVVPLGLSVCALAVLACPYCQHGSYRQEADRHSNDNGQLRGAQSGSLWRYCSLKRKKRKKERERESYKSIHVKYFRIFFKLFFLYMYC